VVRAEKSGPSSGVRVAAHHRSYTTRRDVIGVHLSDLKTVGSRRRLHLSPPLIEMLEQRRVRQQAEELVRGPRWNNANDLIFTTSVGTPLNPDGFGKTVPKLCKEAGLGHWSIHELRHSCASLLINREVPLEVVVEQLGHASIRVTKDVYGHLMPSSRARAAEAMRTVLFEDDVRASTPPSTGLAANDVANSHSEPLTGFSGPPGSRSRHLEGVSRTSRDVHQRPDLLAG
jgi:integrase